MPETTATTIATTTTTLPATTTSIGIVPPVTVIESTTTTTAPPATTTTLGPQGTTVPTTSTTLPPTVPPNLPRTGSDTSFPLAFGVCCVGAGALLLLSAGTAHVVARVSGVHVRHAIGFLFDHSHDYHPKNACPGRRWGNRWGS